MNNKGEKPDKKRRALGLLLSFIIVFSTLAANIPSVSAAEEPQAAETPQATEEPQPGEMPQATVETQPAETPQVTEEPQPSGTPQATEGTDAGGEGEYKFSGVSGKPDKGSFNAAEKKLSTRILQLTNDKYLPAGLTRGKLINQMDRQKQIKQGKDASGLPGHSGTGVHVYIQTKKGSDLKALSEYAKIEDTDEKNGLAAAWVDLSMIRKLASLDSVQSIREVMPPIVRKGSTLSEGDEMLNADDVRAEIGADGTGVKVGIISDGVDHLSAAVKSGDLPEGKNAVRVLSNMVGGDEGTAILEIVHDLAPGAELYFHDCGDTTIAFNSAITELAQSGCDIICDDIGWLTEPFFEDGSIANHVADVMSAYDLIYVSSAGNSAKDHYQGMFVDYGIDSFRDGCPTADFSGDGSDPFLYVQVPADYPLIVVMEWNDPFKNSANDYDVDIYDKETKEYLGGSYYIQDGSECDPVEAFIYYNESSSPQDILIRAYKYKATDPEDPQYGMLAEDKTLEIYTYYGNTYPTNVVAADSIFGHPAVPGVLSCGAIDGNSADAGCGSIEDFSSQGPITMISGTRQKPDLCGIDGVSVTGAGGFPNPFYGTSASAPHVAAAAALLESIFPEESPSNIKQMILDNSVDLGAGGYDNVYGYGCADAFAAVRSRYCKVTFDSRGGSEASPQWIIKGEKANKPLNPSKTGQFFAGWYKEEGCSNAWDFTADTAASDITLYAKWKDSRDVYTIDTSDTYDASDFGDGSLVNIDPELTVMLTNSSASSFDMQIAAGQGVSLSINNLIIKCSDNSALSFTGSGNSLILAGENSLKGGPGKPGIKAEEGTSLQISGDGSVLSISGGSAAGIGGGSGSDGGSVTVSGGTVYAWGIDSPYDIGGGEGGTSGALSISGDSAILLANGTSAAPITSTHELIETDAVQDDIVLGRIKLADEWPKSIYAYINSNAVGKILYNSNDGSGTAPETVVQYKGTSTVLSKGAGLSKDGYPVVSWNELPNGTGTSYSPGAAYTISGNTTLYAVYAAFPLTSYNAYDDLGFVPMDTAIDPERAAVYMTETGGERLYRIDLGTGKIGYAEFPYKAERLAVKNDKIYVTLPEYNDSGNPVSGEGFVGVVDAASFSIDSIFEVTPDPYDIEADAEGRVYIGSGTSKTPLLSVYDAKTGQQVDNITGYRYKSLLDFNPALNKLYSITTNFNPRDIIAYEIMGGDITTKYDSPYYGDFKMSTYMKISPDGQFIFNGSGNVFACAPKRKDDMLYAGTIGKTFESICFDTGSNEFYIASGDRMYIYDYNTWQVKGTQGNGDSYKGLYCNGSSFVSLMQASGGRNYIALNDRAPVVRKKGVSVCQSAVIRKGKTAALAAAFSPNDATNKNVVWSSNNESVAAVSEGVISAVSEGNAVITVTTEDGVYSDTCSVTVVPYKQYNAYNDLEFTPLDTALDTDRAAVYMTEKSGYRLYRIDLGTGEKSEIYFPYKAERFIVRNGKVYIALPQHEHTANLGSDGYGSVGVVDAAAFSVDKIFDVALDPYDIEADGEGRVFVGSGSNQTSILSIYDAVTAQLLDSISGYRQLSLLEYNPEYNVLYSITTDENPRSMTSYQIRNGAIASSYSFPNENGEVRMTAYMKITPDGELIFNGSGNVFLSAPIPELDMYYLGSIGAGFTSICFDLPSDRFYTANGRTLNIYSYDTGILDILALNDSIINLMHDGSKIIALEQNKYSKYYLGVILPAPETIAAGNAGYDKVNVTWSSVSGATGYLLYRSASEYGPYSLVKTTTALGYTNTGLKTGTKYYYKVRAYTGNPTAAGEFSTAVSAAPALDKMSGVMAATYYPTAIKVSWNAVPGRTGYKVYRCDTLDGTYEYIGSTTYTYYKNTGLAVGKTYYYKVRAYRTVNKKNIYNEYSPEASDTTRVFQTTGVKAAMYSVTSNKVYWSSVPGASGYEVVRCDTEDGEYSSLNTTGYTYYYDKTIEAGKTYYYKVRAYRKTSTGNVYGEYSEARVCVSKVAGLKAVMYAVNSNKISWNSVPNRTAYEVYWAESPDGEFTKIPTASPLTSAYIYHTDLEPAKTYYYKVLAYQMVNNERKDSGNSDTVSIVNKMTGAKAVRYSYNSNKITWNSVANRTAYELYRCDEAGNVDLTAPPLKVTGNTYYIDSGLTTDTTYYYRVCAYQMIGGNKVYCNFSDKTYAAPYLSSVTGAKASRYSSSKIKLTWSSVSGATGYEIERCTTGTDFVRIKTTTSRYYYNTGLKRGTRYYYRVRAYRIVGENKYYGNWSKKVNATP